ncbi:hypothetical protein TNCV_529111 [Trichonephila clavipes]|nr:hypothetical protein TNCV_529111 [Trichonephila clavipes]
MIPAYNKKGCAAFHSRRGSITSESLTSFPKENTTMPYSGFEPTQLQAKGHIHHIGWVTTAKVLKSMTSPICVLCDTGQDMTAAHLDECSALNDLNCIVKSCLNEADASRMTEYNEARSNEQKITSEHDVRRLRLSCPPRKPKIAGSTPATVDRFSGSENRWYACHMIMWHVKDPLSINLALVRSAKLNHDYSLKKITRHPTKV